MKIFEVLGTDENIGPAPSSVVRLKKWRVKESKVKNTADLCQIIQHNQSNQRPNSEPIASHT